MPQFIEIIKYEGDNSTFIWKHPSEDFNTRSQLIVHESQEAIFFANGEALDLFGPGRHSLQTQNIPFIKRIRNLASGGETPFHCEVYFINKTEQMAIKWGTDSKVMYQDPKCSVPFEVGASGEMSLRAEDSRKLLVKLVGTESSLYQDKLVSYFRAFLMTKVKTYLLQVLYENNVSIFDLDRYLDKLSMDLKDKLAPDFKDYGISLERFLVTTIVKPTENPTYQRYLNMIANSTLGIEEIKIQSAGDLIRADTEAKKTVIGATAMAESRSVQGYTYQHERAYDVASELARNEGVGNYSSAGMGMGMMMGTANATGSFVGGMMNDALSPINSSHDPSGNISGIVVNTMNTDIPEMIDLKQDAQEVPVDKKTSELSLEEFEIKCQKLQKLKETGLISDEEYEAKRTELLSHIDI